MRHLNFAVLGCFAVLMLGVVAGKAVIRAAVVEGVNPHGSLSLECGACHTTEGWRTIKAEPDFNHAATAFPLVGRHAGVRCLACHPTLVFRDAGTQCVNCHLDIHRGQFANACAECHTPERWANEPEMRRRHQRTRFPLTGVHADVECQACHANGQYVELSTECANCHTQVYQATRNPDHTAAGFPRQCANCHAVTAADWKNATFDHTQTGFALMGGHARANCADCHSAGYVNTSTACYSCHAADYARTDDPNHAAGQFDHDCALCHTPTAWQQAAFDHNLARFPLTGAHTGVECALCHTDGHFTGTTNECYGCHRANFDASTDPNHAAGNFPHSCADCHATGGWSPATFDHNLSTFTLMGAHTTVNCADCHLNGQFTGTPADCWSCHQNNFNGTTNPNHVTGLFDHDCAVCHTNVAWSPASFDHSSTTFQLSGAHANAHCTQCHVSGQFTGTPTDCWSCHQADYTGATDPSHPAAQFPHTCQTCHTPAGWSPSSFSHAATAFPLTGVHHRISCTRCHINGVYAGTPTECYTCHETDFNAVADPNHVTGQFDHNCTVCHSTGGWSPATFDHNNTAFQLTGAHTAAQCALCHVNGQFHGTPTDCWSCHQGSFNQTTDPNHVTAQFSHACNDCHSTGAWQPASFDHGATAFPLTGAHTTVNCTQCHINNVYTGTPTACYACHQDDFEGVTDPNHVTNQFDHDCTVCHSTVDWSPATFNHASTAFPLTGAHTAVQCNLCHVNGQFHGTPTDCWSCHQNNYNSVSDPNHVTNQFDHDCTVCHSATGWSPATFDHNNTAFHLTGAHVSTACNLCHVNGQYHGTPADCWSCHQTDFTGASDPNHIGAGFAHTCQDCHSTSNWNAGFTQHDGPWFPIYSGRHQGTWDHCSDCHTSPANYAVFSCITCHAHNQADMDDAHNEEPGYQYLSSACFTCHPRGIADDRGPSRSPQPRAR